MRNFLLDSKHNGPIHARNKVIAGQDIQILATMNPARTPLSATKEVLTPSDKAIVAYRSWLEKFDDMGWRIDWKDFQARNGEEAAFSIPCPARRTSGNWVLEEIPRIESRQSRQKIESVKQRVA
jgi:hypothetical protein